MGSQAQVNAHPTGEEEVLIQETEIRLSDTTYDDDETSIADAT